MNPSIMKKIFARIFIITTILFIWFIVVAYNGGLQQSGFIGWLLYLFFIIVTPSFGVIYLFFKSKEKELQNISMQSNLYPSFYRRHDILIGVIIIILLLYFLYWAIYLDPGYFYGIDID